MNENEVASPIAVLMGAVEAQRCDIFELTSEVNQLRLEVIKLREQLNAAIESVSSAIDSVKPTVAALAESPILKMLGV